MNGVNLIPAARQAARGRARQLRLWAVGAGACAVALGALQGSLWHAWRSPGEEPASQIQRLEEELGRGEAQDRAIKAELALTKAQAQAAREISDQPDWGLLMTYITAALRSPAPGQSIGEQRAVLDSFRLQPGARQPAAAAAQGAKAAPTPSERGKYLITLTGIAQSQDAASNVAIELKKSDLFQSVTLVETRRATFTGASAVAFTIQCAVEGAGGGE